MRVLLIHPSFPGPFHSLAACFGAMADTRVLFLAERRQRDTRIPGVRRLFMASPDPITTQEARNSAERETLTMLRRGAQTANAMLKLQREGFQPDIVCTASGSGCGFYDADIFPKAFRMVYADWFNTKGPGYNFFSAEAPRQPEDFAPFRARNLAQLNALNGAHLAVTHTHWQRQQFPAALASNILVLPHGVDTSLYAPDPIQSTTKDEEILSFSVRGLEAHNGLSHFMRALPALMSARPHCRVVLVCMADGPVADAVSNAVRAELTTAPAYAPEVAARIHVVRPRCSEDYIHVLRSSAIHVYLTAPYALSSGLLEAMSCSCVVLGSDTEPVREVLQHSVNGFLCDFRSSDTLAKAAIALLQRVERHDPTLEAIRCAARKTIRDQYDRHSLGPLHVKTLLDAYDQQRLFKNSS